MFRKKKKRSVNIGNQGSYY